MNKFIKVLFAGIFVFGLVSCLKDKQYKDESIGHIVDGVPKIIELGVINEPGHDKSIAIDFKDSSLILTLVTVRLAANEVAPEDITVTLDTSSTRQLLKVYDSVNNKTTARYPESLFRFEGTGLKVTIPKGSRESYVKVKTNAINFNPSLSYGLGFKIVSVDKPGYVISQNFGSFLTTLGAKNKFDGNYKMTFTTTGWAAYGIATGVERTWGSNGDGTSIFMITTSGNAVDLWDDYWFGTFIQVAFTTALTNTGFGAAAPRFIFDNSTNKITGMVNTIPDARTRSFELNPSAGASTNYFDPATHNIYADYIMKQPGRPNQLIVATFKYVGPRP